MQQDTEKTKVDFRKWGNYAIPYSFPPDVNIIAFFVDIQGNEPKCCMSYEHIGQHGEAHTDWLTVLEKATPEEYADLKVELESIGYNLEVI